MSSSNKKVMYQTFSQIIVFSFQVLIFICRKFRHCCFREFCAIKNWFSYAFYYL